MELAATRPTAKTERSVRGTVARVLPVMVLVGAIAIGTVWAQEDETSTQARSPAGDTSVEARLDRIRAEMTASLARVEELRRELTEREQALEQARESVEAAEQSGEPGKIEASNDALEVAETWVSSLREEIDEEQKLYEQTTERFQIAREQASLTAGEDSPTSSADGASAPVLETLQRRGQVTQAEQEALLAQQRVEALRGEIEILDRRQERARQDLDRINRILDEGRQLDRQQRQELTGERQRLIDEERSVEDRLDNLRGQIVVAETTLRIKQAEAARELRDYRFWQRQLMMSLGLLLAAILILLLLRLVVARAVKDPDRRYLANRALSIAMTLVLMVGLGLIFLRQFPSLITGIGVVLAGVAIALQEVILSFFGFFAIRGARGYRTGDWIRVGDHYGEVVDIGLLVTILEEVTPIEFQGQSGGTKTGALTWVNNSSIFREKMTNYTRGFPYIWCAMTYTITYESDWQAAERILRSILEGHDEVVTTAKLARKRVAQAAADLALKVDDTSPRVRVWAADSGISLRLRFMVHPRRRRALIDMVNREVITSFTAAPDIDFAYNTLRVIPTPAQLDE